MSKKHKPARVKRAHKATPVELLRRARQRGEVTMELIENAASYLAHHGQAHTRIITRQKEIDNAHVQLVVGRMNGYFERLRSGGTAANDWDSLAACFNVGAIRAKAIDEAEAKKAGEPSAGPGLLEQAMTRGMKAMEEADRRMGEHGNYGFTMLERDDMQDAIDLYAQILALSSIAQMEDALIQSAEEQAVGIAKRDGITVAQAKAYLASQIEKETA